jgi:branched-chain amino acid transport system ATP-binding protein
MMHPALSLTGLSKRFGPVDVIRDADLTIQPGERCAIIGPNGAGKSTLFNLISGIEALDAGQVHLHGKAIHGLPAYQISRQGLARSFQVSSLFMQLSVQDNLRAAIQWRLGFRYTFWRCLGRLEAVTEEVHRLLQQLGMENRANMLAASLSYAEQRMLEIGLTIAMGADVILLDEPTAGMSRSESMAMVDLIKQVTCGRTLLMVEHDMQVVFDLADRIAVMADGKFIVTGTPQEVLADPQVRQLYLGAA